MPTYEYQCEACGHEFSDLLKIAEMNVPCGKPCPKCRKKKVQKRMSMTQIGDPIVLGLRGPSPAFKEVMGGIAKAGGPQVKKNLSGKY